MEIQAITVQLVRGSWLCFGGRGRWIPGQRPWTMVDVEAAASVSHVTMDLRGRVAVCVGLGGDLDEDCRGRWFFDMTRLSSNNAKVDLVATLGRRPRRRWNLVASLCGQRAHQP